MPATCPISSSVRMACEVFDPNVTLGNGAGTLFSPDGTALVIHAGADDYMSQPSGNSGERIACAIIQRR
jgi:superoxide dismutase, Cu-Zn family